MELLEKIDMYLAESFRKNFEKEIRRAKGNKNRLDNLKDTIEGMGDGGMLSKADVKALFSMMSEGEGKLAGWIAIYNGKKLEIKKSEAKDLYNAKLLAIKKLKVPKSKTGLLAIAPGYE